MKILESQSATLSNKEVHAHLISLRSKPHSSPPRIQNFETVIKELSEYLSAPLSSSSSDLSSSSSEEKSQTRNLSPLEEGQLGLSSKIKSLVTRLQCYTLTKAELIMIINLAPEELGLLDCIVEECDLRFSEEDQLGILEVVRDVLLHKREEGEEEEVVGEIGEVGREREREK